MSSKIGIGIITCNRVNYFKQLINSIPDVDGIVVVNDGTTYENGVYPSKVKEVIQHKKNKGIAKSKNDALKYLLAQDCEHIFLFEDDIAIKDDSIIEKYIRASKLSGILHFNYAYHGNWNKTEKGEPNPRLIIKYDEITKIAFHYYVTGALAYFRDMVLKKVGLMDEKYLNVLEHTDHTFRIIQAGFHPPSRWFADVEDSYNSIIELDPLLRESVNSKNIFSIKYRAKIFGVYFMLKNGYRPYRVPTFNEQQFLKILDELKAKYSNDKAG